MELCLVKQCPFKHSQAHAQNTPVFKRGQQCRFLNENKCNFFHHGVRVQNPRGQQNGGQSGQQKECRFQNRCWNISTCSFLHPEQGFQFAKRTPTGSQEHECMGRLLDEKSLENKNKQEGNKNTKTKKKTKRGKRNNKNSELGIFHTNAAQLKGKLESFKIQEFSQYRKPILLQRVK